MTLSGTVHWRVHVPLVSVPEDRLEFCPQKSRWAPLTSNQKPIMEIPDGSLASMVMVKVSPGASVSWETVMEVMSGPSLSITTPRDATYSWPSASTPIATIVWLPLGAELGIRTSCEMAPPLDAVVSPRLIGVEYITNCTFDRG